MKKWYIGNTAAEGDCYFLFQATEEEFAFLLTVIDSSNDENNWLLYESLSGVFSVFDIPFDTREEAEEFFKGNGKNNEKEMVRWRNFRRR